MPSNSTPKSNEHLRLRGIPAHLEEAITELERSLASSEGPNASVASPLTTIMSGIATVDDPNLANQLKLVMQRLSDFLVQRQEIADEDAETLEQERQKHMAESEKAAKQVALANLRIEETQLQLQTAVEEMASLKAQLDNERTRYIQLEKNLIEMKHEEVIRTQELQTLETRLKKTEEARCSLRKQKELLTVQLAAEKSRVVAVTTAFEASERRAQRRQRASFEEQTTASRASTPPVGNCSSACDQIRQDLAECRIANENYRRELSACQERLIHQRETAEMKERRLQEQLNRSRKLLAQTRGRAEKLACLHATLAADRRNAADLIAMLQGQLNQLLCDNQRQLRAKQIVNSAQSANSLDLQEEPAEQAGLHRGQDDEIELDDDTLTQIRSEHLLSRSQNHIADNQISESHHESPLMRRRSVPANLHDAADKNCPTM